MSQKQPSIKPKFNGPMKLDKGKKVVRYNNFAGREVEMDILSEEEKQFIIASHAAYMKSNEINDAFEERYGRRVKFMCPKIDQLRDTKSGKAAFEKYRADYLARIEEVAGYHKRVRLERADKAYDMAFKQGTVRDQIAAIEHQRREVEEVAEQGGISLTIQQINIMSDSELLKRREMLLDYIKTIEHKKEETNGSEHHEAEVGS